MIEIRRITVSQTGAVAALWDRMCGEIADQVDPGDGLPPGLLGDLAEFYVVPESRSRGISRPLATAAVDCLRARRLDHPQAPCARGA
ncbi:MAG: hypothetical protein H0V64_08155 [Geodermatophilaceae bacterium]|nr:hypothetical protein [Geodermatophilaceae bacterium]MDQ3465410.1 hypothetical protein [Actinomycetota bacterium]